MIEMKCPSCGNEMMLYAFEYDLVSPSAKGSSHYVCRECDEILLLKGNE